MIRRFGDGRDWFLEKRFGLFIHWGIYAVPGIHEQHQYRLGVPRGKYQELMHQFNPVQYDPDAWLDLAEQAGMSYVCFTTKHIDGFCMWDTAQTSYNVMNTPYGRDVLGALADACHRREFPLCLYYSCADMHHPNYPNAGRSYELTAPDPGDEPDFGRYFEFVKAQARELCTNYGEIHGFWWDANMLKHHDPAVNEMIRELQPAAVINNRGYDDGDFGTPEREYRAAETDERLPFDIPTEACNAVGTQSWGYREDEDYYSLRHLISSIDTALAKGGNYLLNAGPDGVGVIRKESADILRKIGAWYARTREAFERCEPASELTENQDVLLTRRGQTIYAHLTRSPRSQSVILKPIQESPYQAILLNTGATVETCVDFLPTLFQSDLNYLRLRNLPVDELADQVLVVRLDFGEGVSIR